MEDTASHKIVYKLAHRADKANFSSDCDAILLVILAVNTKTGCRITYPVSGTMYWNMELEVRSYRLQLMSYEFQVPSSKCKLEATTQKLTVKTWN